LSKNENNRQNDLDELTYIISHDLQEPLRMIASYVQLLEKRYSDKLDDNAREYIGFAVKGTNRLKVMMDDLLIYSRIGNPGVNSEPIKLSEVLETAESAIHSKYPNNPVVSGFPSDTVIECDKELMQRLLINLLDNALKFNKKENLEIKVNLRENESEWIVSVSDNGIGIDEEYHGKIFGIFQKLHNHTEYPGSGIGLAICEKIAAKHNGRIWVDSQKGQGSTFHVSIQKSK
jgi:two-component system, chemotaxis family, sensor kinase Cph1